MTLECFTKKQRPQTMYRAELDEKVAKKENKDRKNMRICMFDDAI